MDETARLKAKPGWTSEDRLAVSLVKDDALNILLMVHVIEGLYRDSRLASGLGAQSWFLKTVVLGSLALLTLEPLSGEYTG